MSIRMDSSSRFPKRLLIVTNGSIRITGDGRRHIENLGGFLGSLAAAGMEPVLMGPGVRTGEAGIAHGLCLDDIGVGNVVLPRQGAFRDLRAFWVMAREILRADCVYLFYPGTLPGILMPLCVLGRKPFGLYVRGCRFSLGKWSRLLLRRARFALTVSPSLEADLAATCREVCVIRPMLGFGPEAAHFRVPPAAAPREWNLLFVGALLPEKGVRELLQAARLLEARGFPFRLRVVGGGPLYDELAGLLSRDDRVTLTGPIHDVALLQEEYRWAHMLVHPTHHEGFPRVFCEAMLMGLPILTTMVGGIPGRMRDGENCMEIEVGNAASIAERVERAASDPFALHNMGAKAQAMMLRILRDTRDHADLVAEKFRRALQ